MSAGKRLVLLIALIGPFLYGVKGQVLALELAGQQTGRGKRILSKDETLAVLELSSNHARIVKGRLSGYKAIVFAIALKKGQVIHVAFSSPSPSAYFNLIDEGDASGAALFIGQASSTRKLEFRAESDGVYLLQPYLIRSAARRGQHADYVFRVELVDHKDPG